MKKFQQQIKYCRSTSSYHTTKKKPAFVTIQQIPNRFCSYLKNTQTVLYPTEREKEKTRITCATITQIATTHACEQSQRYEFAL